MKKMLCQSVILCLGVILLLVSSCFAAAAPAKRIAIFPTVNETGVSAPEIEAYCYTALRENLRVPLNSILKVHDYVPTRHVLLAMPKPMDNAWTGRLKDTADELRADLVVGFVITNLEEVQQHRWNGDTLQYTRVTVRLVGYDRARRSLFQRKRHEYYHDELSSSGSLMSLAKKASRYLLDKADFKKDIFPLSNKNERSPAA